MEMYSAAMKLDQFYNLITFLGLHNERHERPFVHTGPWILRGTDFLHSTRVMGTAWIVNPGFIRVSVVGEWVVEKFRSRMPDGWEEMLSSYIWARITEDGRLGPLSLSQFVVSALRDEKIVKEEGRAT